MAQYGPIGGLRREGSSGGSEEGLQILLDKLTFLFVMHGIDKFLNPFLQFFGSHFRPIRGPPYLLLDGGGGCQTCLARDTKSSGETSGSPVGLRAES